MFHSLLLAERSLPAGYPLRQLSDLEQARQQAEHISILRPSHRIRSSAFAQLALASVQIAEHQPDQACGIAA